MENKKLYTLTAIGAGAIILFFYYKYRVNPRRKRKKTKEESGKEVVNDSYASKINAIIERTEKDTALLEDAFLQAQRNRLQDAVKLHAMEARIVNASADAYLKYAEQLEAQKAAAERQKLAQQQRDELLAYQQQLQRDILASF
jgi:hypothetical protein